MQVTGDAQRFFGAPRSQILVTRTYVCAFTRGGTLGVVARGHVDAADIWSFARVLAAAPSGRPLRQHVDLRGVRGYSRAAMDALTEFYRGEHQRITARIEREAVVRPEGALGAFAEGFYRANPMPFDTAVFSDEGAAFAWLGDPEGWGSLNVARWLERDPATITSQLTDLIMQHGAGIQLAEAARGLGLSTRTLQRRLKGAGLDFRRLRRRVLVDEGRRRLASTTTPIKTVAFDLGFADAKRFSEAFQRELRASPSDFRRSSAKGRSRRPGEPPADERD